MNRFERIINPVVFGCLLLTAVAVYNSWNNHTHLPSFRRVITFYDNSSFLSDSHSLFNNAPDKVTLFDPGTHMTLDFHADTFNVILITPHDSLFYSQPISTRQRDAFLQDNDKSDIEERIVACMFSEIPFDIHYDDSKKEFYVMTPIHKRTYDNTYWRNICYKFSGPHWLSVDRDKIICGEIFIDRDSVMFSNSLIESQKRALSDVELDYIQKNLNKISCDGYFYYSQKRRKTEFDAELRVDGKLIYVSKPVDTHFDARDLTQYLGSMMQRELYNDFVKFEIDSLKILQEEATGGDYQELIDEMTSWLNEDESDDENIICDY